jgi:NitT/TauT family transport system ATP-binding protein
LIVGFARERRAHSFRRRAIDGICTKIGYVTQKDNLPAHLDRKRRDRPGDPRTRARGARAEELIGRVGFGRLRGAYSHELSGGMRQRANIIRTLIYDPELILMDEPFGPLDAQTRIVLQDQLLKLWSATKKTIVFITHDLIEEITLADRVVLMSSRPGRIKLIENVTIPRPRDVFKIHESPEFRAVYERLWQQLRPEVNLAQ